VTAPVSSLIRAALFVADLERSAAFYGALGLTEIYFEGELDGASAAAVVNQGTIRATGGGDVFLIARHVENAGSISAPGGTVGLAGGSEVLVRSTDTGDGRIAVRMGPGDLRLTGRPCARDAAPGSAAGGARFGRARPELLFIWRQPGCED
jgi:catechol 2,3-dioxygenase-like lactoylglutathione lyase family enzyme